MVTTTHSHKHWTDEGGHVTGTGSVTPSSMKMPTATGAMALE